MSMSASAFAQTVKSVPMSSLVVPRNVTYWEMFTHATLIVKAVMLLLLAASLVTWTIWIAKLVELRSAKSRLKADIATLNAAPSIEKAGAMRLEACGAMLKAVRTEMARLGKLASSSVAEGIKERVAARLVNAETNAVDQVMKGTVVLATIGAIAPFVGLFGTVWGIMNSFIGISQSNTTNLAVVAPGIAEALLATAMGLVAAIPAVVMYNAVARAIAGYRRQLSEASTQIACLLSQDLDGAQRADTVSVKAA
ncbi:tonB-system energizer ExbB [Sphingomonas sp.]|uniref:tonB-system energizer ExbB n=1 Tax=Sphingomonas sp. TaxID=28214 RepID=UPI0025CEC6ED|nr:tonB-system energizer ExbB [Sphingomonas sp.]